MNLQEISNTKNPLQKSNWPDSSDHPRNSLLINSSFSLANHQKPFINHTNDEVLKKVSETIVSLHSALVPKTENIEIYRDLSEQEHQMLKQAQENPLIHTILTGVLAIDSCLKYINKEETYVISSLMKGVTICLGNFKKIEQEFLSSTGGKVSQNFLRFYDSLKLIISDIHKIPAAKIKKNELQKHNDFISKSHLNNELLNSLNRQQNLLFSLLAQENNSLRIKVKDIEKQLSQIEKEKTDLLKEMKAVYSDKKKFDSENNLTQTGSESAKGHPEEILIRQLKDQILEKNQIIMKMNDEFTIEIEKYDKIFKRLQDQNKQLKKYNDLDTAYILEELEYEVQMLRQEKRNNQSVINQIMNQMNSISWTRNDFDYGNQSYSKDFKPRYDPRFANTGMGEQRMYETSRNRCPSVSPTNKQESMMGRYFSPNFDLKEKGRNALRHIKGFEPKSSGMKRDESPRFGTPQDDKRYEMIKERVQRMNMQKQGFGMQIGAHRRDFKEQPNVLRLSQSKHGNMKMPSLADKNLEISKLKQQMRRSKFMNQEMGYM